MSEIAIYFICVLNVPMHCNPLPSVRNARKSMQRIVFLISWSDKSGPDDVWPVRRGVVAVVVGRQPESHGGEVGRGQQRQDEERKQHLSDLLNVSRWFMLPSAGTTAGDWKGRTLIFLRYMPVRKGHGIRRQVLTFPRSNRGYIDLIHL
jgi:hypothetical protein